MSFITIPISDLRRDLSSIIPKLSQPVFVTQHGRVKAVLMDIDAYNEMLDDLDEARLVADPEFQASVAEVREGKTVPFEVVLRENGLLSS